MTLVWFKWDLCLLISYFDKSNQVFEICINVNNTMKSRHIKRLIHCQTGGHAPVLGMLGKEKYLFQGSLGSTVTICAFLKCCIQILKNLIMWTFELYESCKFSFRCFIYHISLVLQDYFQIVWCSILWPAINTLHFPWTNLVTTFAE